MNKQNPTSAKRILFSALVIFCSSLSMSLFAQNNVQILDETSMRAIMDNNKMTGKPIYEGINSKFSIVTPDNKVSVADSAKLIKDILAMPEVLSCVFLPHKHSLVVTTKKQGDNNEIALLKGKIVPYNLYVANYQEITYTEKKK